MSKKEQQTRRLSTYYVSSLRSLAEHKAATKKALKDADKTKLVSILQEVAIDPDLLTENNEKNNTTPCRAPVEAPADLFESRAAGAKKHKNAPKMLSSRRLDLVCETKKSFSDKIIDPAYIKFAENLRYDNSDFVRLPAKYHDVYDIFVEIDKILYLHHNRKEACVFSDLANNVNKNIADTKSVHKQLNSAVFSKIYRLRPDFFHLYVNHAPSGLLRLAHDFLDSLVMLQPDYKSTLSLSGINKKRVMTSHLLWRKKQIYEKLIERVLHCHNLFLYKRYQLKINPEKIRQIKRFHPKFQLEMVDTLSNDEENEDIYQQINLKEQKSTKNAIKRAIAARQVLINNDLKINNELNRIITDDASSECSSNISMSSPMLSKVSASFLEKIKMKENKQRAAESVINNFEERKVEEERMIKRLPDLLKIIGCYFAAEKKTSYHCESLVDKIVRNEKDGVFEGFERFELLKMMSLLAKNIPEMISLKKLDRHMFIKLTLLNVESIDRGILILKKRLDS